MSTSPEAKQAAVEWAKTKSAFGNQGREEFVFAQGYDAATAKLEAEVEYWKEHAETEQNARQEVHEGQKYWEDAAAKPSAPAEPLFGDHIKEAVGAIKPLFEPSEPTPEYCPCYSYVDGDTDPDCPMHGTHGKSLLKAPTPEVEKLARECAELLHRPHISEDGLRDGITQALAQARAPLVAALKDIAWGGNRPVDELRSVAAIALTGTGE